MIKKILITLGVIVTLLVVGLLIFLLTFDLNHYRPFVMEQASKALGRPVEIRSLSTKLSLIPTVKVEGVRILDPDQKEPVLDIPRLEAVIDLPPLVHRQIFIQKITVPQADFVWRSTVKNAPKKENEKENVPPTPKASSNKIAQIWIDSVVINALNASIGREKPYNFKINKFTLKGLSKFSFGITYLKNTINVNGNFGSILDLITQKQNVPVDLTLTQDKASVKINGKIEDLKNLKRMTFRMDADVPNLSAFLKTWDIHNDKIPPTALAFTTSVAGDLQKAELTNTTLTIGKSDFTATTQGTLKNLSTAPSIQLDTNLSLQKGDVADMWRVKPFNLDTKIIANNTSIIFSDIALNAGKSDIKGQLRFDHNSERPYFQGKLDSVYFDVHDMAASAKNMGAQTSAAPQKTKILTDQEIPFYLAQKINADLKVNIAHLKFSEQVSDYADVTTTTNLKNGVLKSSIFVKVLEGTIDNQLNIDAEKKNISLTTHARNIRPDKIQSLAKSIRGTMANADISLSGTGATVHQLAAHTMGQIVVELSEGEIINKDFNSLPAALNIIKGKNNSLSFSTQDQKTELLCGAVNMSIKNGVASSNNQIALETDTLNFIINGQINLKNETLNLNMIPSVAQTRGMANDLLNVTQSVQLSGPWTNIKASVNPFKATETLLQALGQKISGAKKQSVQINPTALCQKVLGRNLSHPTNKKTVKAPVSAPAKPAPVANTQKQNLKQQLVRSLSQALTDQTTKKQ